MKKELIELKGCDGAVIPGVVWTPDSEPRALLQVTHGMTEHMGRYAFLAEKLTAEGIAVAGFDLRGHGVNPSKEPDCASFGEGKWEAALQDMHLFHGHLKQKFPGCPHLMMGFSLGSFLLREYLNIFDDDIAGAAILGTGHQPGPVLSLMMAIVGTQVKKAAPDGTTDLVRKLSFGTYNQKFAPERTAADWLCADETELDLYLADPLCRKDISAGLFRQLLASMKNTGSKTAYDRWNKALPVLLMSGKDDPVGDMGKGVERVKLAMERAGADKVELHLFSGARHDLLHEEKSGCAEQARAVLTGWILRVIR